MTITPAKLRKSAARQRASAPDGATVPLADELEAAAMEIERLTLIVCDIHSELSERAQPECEPMAYAAIAADGSEAVYVASLKEQAEACCRENGWFLVPLYATPYIMNEEREAIEEARCAIGRSDDHSESEKKRIRGTLERMKQRLE